LYRVNGNTLGNHYSLTKLKWIQQHQPELYQQADHFLHWSGFVSFMLGAEALVDYSLRIAPCCSTWSTPIGPTSCWAGSTRSGEAALTVPSGTIIGSLSALVATRLGLPHVWRSSAAHTINAATVSGCA